MWLREILCLIQRKLVNAHARTHARTNARTHTHISTIAVTRDIISACSFTRDLRKQKLIMLSVQWEQLTCCKPVQSEGC